MNINNVVAPNLNPEILVIDYLEGAFNYSLFITHYSFSSALTCADVLPKRRSRV